ncbi:MAG: DUF5011 domain-containing protein [Bacteroidetes bacterium]|nr:DUF5011 domain-containing protein [Bacteroidota bacterium]MBT4340107.1 DUF5011 domain-containing protein [Bacteroidota bacterium]MBT5528607.1 DUF5011 domain-containing protein [Cytophagia bacterium]MBT7827377.1 DUF5011 domain-containing protein [Bacteroidota bacterium]
MIKHFTRLFSLMLGTALFLVSFSSFGQLSGNYTIGGGGANYATILAAVADLSSSGVSGPVNFTVNAGTYNGRIVLNSISGASATNRITFDGGDKATTSITYTGSSTSDRANIVFSGAEYITFKNFHIENFGSNANAMGLFFTQDAQYNRVEDCDIIIPTLTNGYTSIAVLISNSESSYSSSGTNASFNVIKNNIISGGYYCIYWRGNTNSNPNCWNNHLIGNTVSNYYYYGMYSYYMGGSRIEGNVFNHAIGTTNGYCIMDYYGIGDTIESNILHAGYIGLYVYYQNYYDASNSYHSLVQNNMISDFTYTAQMGIYGYRAERVEFYHNSVWINPGNNSYSYTCLYLYYADYPKVKNNLFVNTGNGRCLTCINTTLNSGDIDYNTYYSSNSSFVNWNNTEHSNLASLKAADANHNQNCNSSAPHFSDFSNLHYSTGTVPIFTPYMSAVPLDLDYDTRTTSSTMMGADEHEFPAYDLDLISILAPIVPAPGNNTISFSFVNAGANDLSAQNLTFQYSINGGSWVSETYAMAAYPKFTQPRTYTFNTAWYIPAAGTYDLCVRVSPQITNDPDASDEICYSACTGFKGNYTIDAAGGGNFTNFNDAISGMANCGVSGPVHFTVKSGTYAPFEVPEIKGASAINSITFEGVGKDKVTVYHPGAVGSTDDQACIYMGGGDYVTISNMTLENAGVNYARGIHLYNSSNYNRFENIDIFISKTGTNSYLIPINGSNSKTSYSTQGDWGHNNLFTNIFTEGGYWSFVVYGGADNTFDHCDFTEAYYYGSYSYYAASQNIQYCNYYNYRTNINSYGCMNYFGTSDTIISNTIRGAGRYGMYVYYSNYYAQNEYSLVANNSICGFQNVDYNTGFYIYQNYNNNFVNNVAQVDGKYANSYSYSAIYAGYCYYCNFYNNVFISTNNNYVATFYYPYYSNCDYNDYIHTGTATNYFYYPNTNKTWTSFMADQNNTNYFGAHDQNSYYQVNPQFVGNCNHHLVKGSLGLQGILVPGNDFDIDGDPRCKLTSFVGVDEPAWKTTANDFVADDTMCLYTPLVFYNTGIEEDPHNTAWYLNGDFKTNDWNYVETFNQVGWDTVSLIQETCSGADSIGKAIYIESPTVVPSVEFMASKNVLEVGEPIVLQDLTKNCPTAWMWEISPATQYNPATGNVEPTYRFINGSTDSSRNPEIVFDQNGSFDICLTASNAVGTSAKDCKNAYLNVKFSAAMCGQFNEATQLYGSLYDDGGNGNYSPYTSCNYLIRPCGDNVELTIAEMNLATGSFLRIYDGASNRGYPMWDPAYGPEGITGDMSHVLFDTVLMSTRSGMVYVEFDAGVSASTGFKLEWASIGAGSYTAPVASFMSEDTACIVLPMYYENTSYADTAYSKFTWDYDGNGAIDATSIHGEFNTQFPGIAATYKTTLTVDNCGGVDTFVKEIVLINPQAAPVGDFSADVKYPVSNQDVVTFSANTFRLSCVNEFEWIITPNTFYFENGTSMYSEHPEVVFQDTTCYDVTLVIGNSNSPYSTTLNKVCYIHPKKYCIPGVLTLHQDMGINRFACGDIDNSSASGMEGYNNYTNSYSTTLIVGQVYTVTVERNTNFNKVSNAVWVDFNNNGDFTDPGDLVASIQSSSAKSWSATFVVPTNAEIGASVMRVSTNYASFAAEPCGPNQFGEIEDYRVFISPDNVAPAIAIIGNNPTYVEQGYVYVDSGAVATDNIMGIINTYVHNGVPLFGTSSNVNTAVLGQYYVTYSACDTIWNCQEVKRKVIVTPDVSAPVITLYGGDPISVSVNKVFVDTFYSAWDDAEGNLTSQVMISGNLDVYQIGTYSRTYYVEDSKGNSDTKMRTMIVEDNAAPDVVMNGDNPMFVEISTSFTDPGVTYSDNYWPLNKVSLGTTGLVDINKAGTYKIDYQVTDYSNNSQTVSRTVIVWDSTAPMITALGGDVIELEVHEMFVDPGLDISDNSLSGFVVTRWGSFLTTFPNETPNQLGNYIIFYKVTDASGNVSDILGRVIKVVDSHAPELALKGSPYKIIEKWDALGIYNEEGYTLKDAYYDNSVITVTTDDNVDLNFEGLYHVCYQAKDPSGNMTPQICRLVRVIYQNTSIDDNTETKVAVYPNPTNGRFVVELEVANGSNVSVSILNLLGEEVKVVSRNATAQDQYEIDLSDFANGVYLVKVQTGDNSILKRIVLSK